MNSVRARLWRFIVQTNPDGTSDIVATEVGQGPLPVALSRLVHINALACDVRKIIDPRVRDQEVALLTSYLAGSTPGGPLTVDFPALLASSGHIGRFVAECAGLGVMTAASEALFMWKSGDGLHSFDVLPGHLVKRYGGGGVRPDLLFQMCCGPLAGEARGRRVRTKALFPAKETPQQRRRLLQLADWSAKHTDHAYFMSWVWIGPNGVSVDIFLPAGNDQVESDLMLGWIEEPGHAVWEIRAERRRDVRREAPAGPLIADDSEPPLNSLTIGYDDPPLNERVQSAEEHLDAALSRRFETSSDVEGSIADVAVRGRWVPADGLGPATHEVLLGVLASRLPEHMTRRGRDERAEQNLDAYLDGRLLTVVRRIDEDRPSWEQITEGLLEVP
ncbi:hypothetical protein [Streptomyces sp. CBMA123]|uniref:hypothetical protein n=1 Tax=Streptomyces sp. CBMA123 TaxID=1896313 RepID=UPI001661CC78|nr:hypothetical protein [Streptomyces sp. CBMA123]MBD0688440.1 hypothetical protein [Streptomyces sp. CBMA123]